MCTTTNLHEQWNLHVFTKADEPLIHTMELAETIQAEGFVCSTVARSGEYYLHLHTAFWATKMNLIVRNVQEYKHGIKALNLKKTLNKGCFRGGTFSEGWVTVHISFCGLKRTSVILGQFKLIKLTSSRCEL